jgi:RND family efflux transporter MFP subunit
LQGLPEMIVINKWNEKCIFSYNDGVALKKHPGVKMKKSRILSLILIVLALGFLVHCGKSSDSPKGSTGEEKSPKAGEKEPGKKDGEIDVDKLDIPDRLKKAIKSGRIPMDRVKQMLEMRKGMGGAPTVEIQPVKRRAINAFLVLNGVVEPERKVEVYSRLSAYVEKIVREEGAFVKEGSVLALLDDTEIGISYRQAQLQLQQAELTLKDESANLERSKRLNETEMISEQEYQTAQANYNKAKLDHQNKLESFKDLEMQLSYTRIKSPVDGYITERLIEVGTRVNSNQQVYTVEDFSPLLIKVYVPTADIINLKTGMAVEVTTDVLKGRVFKGKIKLINPRIDVQSGTVKVTVEVFDKSMTLTPGMFVETKILIRNKPDALVVPRKSVVYKQDETYMFVFQRMQVSKRLIETGITEGDNIEITGGLKEGERIVTVGVEGLKDGMKVNVQGLRGMGGPRPSNRQDEKPGEQRKKSGEQKTKKEQR